MRNSADQGDARAGFSGRDDHLARADQVDQSMTRDQVSLFERTLAAAGLVGGAERVTTSIGNSAGTLGWPVAHATGCDPVSRSTAFHRSAAGRPACMA